MERKYHRCGERMNVAKKNTHTTLDDENKCDGDVNGRIHTQKTALLIESPPKILTYTQNCMRVSPPSLSLSYLVSRFVWFGHSLCILLYIWWVKRLHYFRYVCVCALPFINDCFCLFNIRWLQKSVSTFLLYECPVSVFRTSLLLSIVLANRGVSRVFSVLYWCFLPFSPPTQLSSTTAAAAASSSCVFYSRNVFFSAHTSPLNVVSPTVWRTDIAD